MRSASSRRALTRSAEAILRSLAESLWALDQNQLRSAAQRHSSLAGHPAVEIREVIDRPNPIHISVGDRSAHASIIREYPLDYVIRGTKRPIGMLYVEATLNEVYRNLLKRTLVILASQAAKTFLVSLFILYIVHLLVTRHLIAIAGFVGSYNLARPPPPLRLNRRPPQGADELDKVADAFNALCANLQRAYSDLQEVNARLQRDLFVRQKAEQDAHLSEQRFRDYAETASDWFWETGPDHDFTYISERLDAFGMDRAALIGKTPHRCRRSTSRPSRRNGESMWRCWNGTSRSAISSTPAATWPGGCAMSASTAGPIFAADGRFIGYRGTGTDLTEQHETTERLRQSQKMDAIGQLTGGVAHDFNNVLTVITGHDRDPAGRRGRSSPARRDRPAHRRRGDARRRDHLPASDLRAAPAVAAGRDRHQRAWSPIPAKLLKPMLGEHVEIDAVLAGNAWSALADPSQLSAAIVNLAVNARDAMPGGGKLTLETANVVIDEVACVGWRDASRRVRDDCGHRHWPGHPRRHHRSGVRALLYHQGNGARHRARAQRWSTVLPSRPAGPSKIESEEGRGTVVKLYLPRSEGQAPAKQEPRRLPCTLGGQETILVVEDDPLVRGYVIAQLGGLGYKTLVASEAEAALALVDQGSRSISCSPTWSCRAE